MPLVCNGTISIDTVYTPDGEHREGVLGGSCTYFAAAASFYGAVRLVAAVGDDFPEEHRRMIEHFGSIDVAGLEQRAGSKTFRWGGKYLDDMDHRDTLFTELNVLAEDPPTVPEPFRDSKFVFLANSHPAVQMSLLEQFPDPALVVADTMDLWIETTRAELELLLGRIHGLVLNYDEAEQLTGCRNTVTAARHLLDFGPRFVVVKKGEHGCILAHRDGLAALPAYPSETVVDPTGAGDAFAGGMMGAMAAEHHARRRSQDAGSFDVVRRALAHGTIAASFNIESFSLDRLMSLSREELDARYHEFLHMLRLE